MDRLGKERRLPLIVVSIEKSLDYEFKLICNNNRWKYSNVIRNFIIKFIKKNKINGENETN